MRLLILLFTLSTYATLPEKNPQVMGIVSKALELKLYEEKQWIRLLHYRPKFFGGWESEADAAEFFNSDKGKVSPKEELVSTIKGIFAPLVKDQNQHVICKFPARVKWLNQKLKFKGEARPVCDKYIEFIQQKSAQSASLVFSSYYINTPASAFGHTLLRLNQGIDAKTGRHFELLDWGINYAATVTTNNALMYAILGSMGGFKGHFSAMPYYYKIREYNDFESRDLWSYNLNLKPEVMRRLLDHIWELGNTYFDYYYFSENCSYHMLTLLEAADPNLDLTADLPAYVIPIETIKAVERVPGLVKSIDFRPSILSKFNRRVAKLSSREKAEMKRIIDEDKLTNSNLSVDERKHAIDAAIDYIDLKYAGEILLENNNKPIKIKKNQLLLARSKIKKPSVKIKINPRDNEFPHLSHGPERFQYQFGNSKEQGTFSRIGWRYALHDFLDPKPGQPASAEIEMVSFELRHNHETHRFWLEDLRLFNVQSLSPMSEFARDFSWRATFGAKTLRGATCDQCLAPNAQVGGGITLSFGEEIKLRPYLLAEMQYAFHEKFNGESHQFEIGPHLGFYINWNDFISTHFAGKYYYFVFPRIQEYTEFKFDHNWAFTKHWSMRTNYKRIERDNEYALGFQYYF